MTKVNVVDIDSPEFEKRVKEITSTADYYTYPHEVIKAQRKYQRFVQLPDGWIRDLKKRKDYGTSSTKSMNKKDAIEWCKKIGGRLPKRNELIAIQDLSKHSPSCHPIFSDMKSECYWSDTKYAPNDSCSWCVSFGYGGVYGYGEGIGNYVRPVRSSQ